MMAVGTSNLRPDGGSWLVQATSDPAKGWQPIDGSWRPWRRGAPTQISGYLARDQKVYVAATSFDRSQGVGLYRAEPDAFTTVDVAARRSASVGPPRPPGAADQPRAELRRDQHGGKSMARWCS